MIGAFEEARGEADATLQGILPVLQVPFDDKGEIIEADLRQEVDFCIRAGVHGLVVPALASEFMVLTEGERRHLVEVVVDQAGKRVPVVAGVAAPSTKAAVEFSRHARGVGAAAVMALPPYVRRPAFDGVYAYYAAIADAASLPVVIQNAPPPFGISLNTALLCRLLSEIDAVQYIKEERQPPGHFISDLLATNPPGLQGIFSGTAGVYLLSELGRGIAGCMPSAAMPDLLVAIYKEFTAGRVTQARDLYNRVLPLLSLEMSVLMAISKEVLRRRGIFSSVHLRDPEFPLLDAGDLAELDALWPNLEAALNQEGVTRADYQR